MTGEVLRSVLRSRRVALVVLPGQKGTRGQIRQGNSPLSTYESLVRLPERIAA